MEKNLEAEQEAKEKVKRKYLLPSYQRSRAVVLNGICVHQMSSKKYEKHLAHFYFLNDWLGSASTDLLFN